jgi:hypothetical protein
MWIEYETALEHQRDLITATAGAASAEQVGARATVAHPRRSRLSRVRRARRTPEVVCLRAAARRAS